MRPVDSKDMPDEEWDRLQRVIGYFETAWTKREKPQISAYLSDDDPFRESLLIELVHADLEFRLKAGESARVEDYLRKYPSLSHDRATVLGLIQAEWSFRRRRDPDLPIDRFRERFPDFRDDLEVPPADPSTINPPPLSNLSGTTPYDTSLPRRLGKFELRQKLGKGSFGVVYRAWDTVLNREVAIKVPRPEAIAAPNDSRSFLREARNAINLRHPHIVAIHDAGPIEGTICLIRAYIEGANLAERLREAPFSPEEAAALMALVAEALDYAHHRGIFHRDLKPSNILLDLQGLPHIADFGLAKSETSDSSLTPSGHLGAMIGTPAYMPPEQARGESNLVDARSDVYSAGVVLYELLTGSVPFRGRGRMLLIQIEESAPIPPRSLNEEIPPELEKICLRALAKAPADRYQAAKDLADDLRSFLTGRPLASRHNLLLSTHLWPGSRGASVVISALLLLLTMIMASLWLQAEGRRNRDVLALQQTYRSLVDLAQPAKFPGREEAVRKESLNERIWAEIRALAPTLDGDPALLDLASEAHLRLAERAKIEELDSIAAQHLSKVIEISGRIARESGDAISRRKDLAVALADLSAIHGRSNHPEESRRLVDRSLEIWVEIRDDRRSRAKGHPTDPEFPLGAAEAALRVAEIELALGKHPDIGEVESTVLRLETKGRLSPIQRTRLAGLALDLAGWESSAQLPEKSLQSAERSLRLYQEIPVGPVAEAGVARCVLAIARSNRDLHREPQALREFRRAVGCFESLVQGHPTEPEFRHQLGAAQFELGQFLDRSGHRPDAIQAYRSSIVVLEGLHRDYPQGPITLAELGHSRAALASALGAENQVLRSIGNYLRAINDQCRAIKLAPGLKSSWRELSSLVRSLARMILTRLTWLDFYRTIDGNHREGR